MGPGGGVIKYPLGVIDETLCLSDLFGSIPGFGGGNHSPPEIDFDER